MNEQPEALRLADELAIQDQCDFYKVCEEAALELRWLHEENERLHAENEQLRADALVMLKKLRDWTLQYTDQEQP